jgi:hypothetical protein
MAGTAYLRYSNRTVTKRAGGRYDVSEIWIVPNIKKTGGGNNLPDDAWQHEALGAPDLPQIGDTNQDGGYVCISVSPRSLDDQGTAYVDVRWQEDPLTLVTDVHFFSATKTKPAWQGVATNPGTVADNTNILLGGDTIKDIRNSAGDRYNPTVTYEVPLQRVEISFHASLLWHDDIEWDQYLKHWNVSDYEVTQTDPDNPDNSSSMTYPAGTLMFADKRAPLVKEPFFHRLVTCVFLYDPDLWGMRVPDMGPRCLKHLAPDGSGGVTIKPWTTDGHGLGTVTDALGRPFSGPAELDGEGNQMVPDGDGHMPSAIIYQWWPVDDHGNLLSAEFDDLDLFTPERELSV